MGLRQLSKNIVNQPGARILWLRPFRAANRTSQKTFSLIVGLFVCSPWVCCLLFAGASGPAFPSRVPPWACPAGGRVPARPPAAVWGVVSAGFGSVGRSGLGGFPCRSVFGLWSSALSFLLVFCVLRVFFFAFFLLRVVFFRSFVSCLVLFPSVLARSPRLSPWFGVSAGRVSSAGSLSACPVFRFRVGSALRSALPLLALVSRPGSAVALGVPGSWGGQWLALVLLRWAFRLARVVSRLLASSSRCFLSFF